MTNTCSIKKCGKCGEAKPLEEFYRRSSAKDGHQARCKKCMDANWNEYKARPEKREFIRTYVKEYNARPESKAARRLYLDGWYKRTPRGNLRTSLQGALKRCPTEDPITLDELCSLFEAQDGKCAISGVILTWRTGKILPTSLSVDRIDSARGYVRSNVRLVCFAVNAFRGQMSDDEMFNMALAIVSNMKRPMLRLVS